jgi:heat shock protein HtpX
MRRRFSTRDLSLSVRMALALTVVGLLYLALEVGLAIATVAAAYDRAWIPCLGLALFAAAIPLLLRKHYRGAAALTLRAVRAKPEPMGDALVPIAARLAALADIAAPDVVVARSRTPNALAVPTGGTHLIVVTSELLRRLEPPEIEAVLAHEITHLANGDGKVMTFVGGPALAGSAMWRSDDARGKLAVALFYWPFWLLGLLLMRGMSRYREYTADRGAALLTGAPEQLMSALTKLAGVTAKGDLRGGAAISALCVVPTRKRRGLFADHPPLERRLARLAAMAREHGRAVGP